jgi:hypothetical protein
MPGNQQCHFSRTDPFIFHEVNLVLGFALLFLVAGCTSVTTSSMHCTSLTREDREHVFSDLDHLLVGDGFRASSASETRWGRSWENHSFSSLWKGQAELQVGAYTNSTGMNIDVFYYRGEVNANRALIDAIVACVKSDAPSAKVDVRVKKEYAPSSLSE